MSCKPRILVEDAATGSPKQRPEESEISSDTYGQHQLINSKLFDRLKECLLCQVCSDVFTRPLNVKDCLHKFCAKCIEDYNRKYKKECPQCRQQILSRRHLREDMKLQALISKLISDVAKFNQLESRRRSDAFNSKVHSREYRQACLDNKQRVDLQSRAVERDKEHAQMEKAQATTSGIVGRGGHSQRGGFRGTRGNHIRVRRGGARGPYNKRKKEVLPSSSSEE
jgi:hypothetical protein